MQGGDEITFNELARPGYHDQISVVLHRHVLLHEFELIMLLLRTLNGKFLHLNKSTRPDDGSFDY